MAKKHKLKVSVVISGYVNELIKKLHQQYPHRERSGIARIQKMDDHYLVSDIKFPKQTNSGGETELKEGGLQDLLEEIVINNPEQLHERKCWLHSHHSMGCFRSLTDETAKASFNDNNTEFRWSIVTSYDAKGINYKCALSIFKPVNIEFDVPVRQEQFRIEDYIQDYEVYLKAYQQLEAERDMALKNLTAEYVPSYEEINKLVEIFNVEGSPEDKEVCKNLLIKNNKQNHALNINIINDTFTEQVEDLQGYFGCNIFSEKLKELEDNIEVYQYLSGPYVSKPLFDEATKYKNNTLHDNRYNHGRGDY